MSSAPAQTRPELPPGTEPPAARRRGWLRPLILTLVAVLVGLAVWRIVTAREQAEKKSAARAAMATDRPTPVQVVTVSARPMPIYLTALGTVTPYYSVTVKARVNGTIDRVNFVEGQQVRKGETLMVIDPTPYKAALDQAKGTLAHDQALLENAKAEAARYTALFKEGVISKESMDAQVSGFGQYQGAVKADEAAIETARISLQWCYVTSPIDGRIGLRLVDPGNVITANTTNLVVINQFQPIAVYFPLPQDQLQQALERMRAANGHRLQAEAFDRSDTHRIATGYLLTADNQIDTTTGTAKLKAVFDNKDELLFPNQFVNIHLVLEQRPQAIVVPTATIQTGTEGPFVWRLDQDNVVHVRRVDTELAEGQQTVLKSGVSPGDRIVIDGADKLRDGARVSPRAQPVGGGTGGGVYSSLINQPPDGQQPQEETPVVSQPGGAVANPPGAGSSEGAARPGSRPAGGGRPR